MQQLSPQAASAGGCAGGWEATTEPKGATQAPKPACPRAPAPSMAAAMSSLHTTALGSSPCLLQPEKAPAQQ